LLADGGLRDRMGRAGRAAVETYYNWDRVGRDTVAFVDRVTSAPSSGEICA
jgi:glycosyltransferase involved in cell wall biosynthesis